uniref:Nicotinic acetylcholine receptor n=1 Tax=Polyphagotarsonemus latus TaxID=1204166 RepID=A0AAN0LHM2_9ACAR
MNFILFLNIFVLFLIFKIKCNPDAKRLYEDLMAPYNKLVRPVFNSSEMINVKLGLKLFQILDLNLKKEYLLTNMMVSHEWNDYSLRWNFSDYGNVKQLYIPADKLWLPDIILYNNADDAYELSIKTNAVIHYDGTVIWQSPTTFKSHCEINVEYFPFDLQTCKLHFTSWTHGDNINLKHHNYKSSEPGIDLNNYFLNVEWDVLSVTALEQKKNFNCCTDIYSDIFFTIHLRRKTFFYIFSLLIPISLLSFLTVFVFYLPANSGEKVSLIISILLSLTFLLLIYIDIMPSTSICLPVLGKYLIFILLLVILSLIITCFILNVHFRSPNTHKMSPWSKTFFLKTLPPYLLIDLSIENQKFLLSSNNNITTNIKTFASKSIQTPTTGYIYSAEINRAIRNTLFIAYHLENKDTFENCKQDWQIMALVLDRMFFYLFFLLHLVGTIAIFLSITSIYDSSNPIDLQQSKINKDFENILKTF